MKNKIDKLNELGQLLNSGAITQEEFNNLKSELLNPSTQSSEDPKLTELRELLNSGTITQQEFDNLKSEIINPQSYKEKVNHNKNELSSNSKSNNTPGIDKELTEKEKRILGLTGTENKAQNSTTSYRNSQPMNIKNILTYTLFVLCGIILLGYKACSVIGPNENLNLDNETEIVNYVQGKWTGDEYGSFDGQNYKWDVRVLIQGNKVTLWKRLSKDKNTGKTRRWSDVEPTITRENLSVGYLQREGNARDIVIVGKSLQGKFLIFKNGRFQYDRHTLNKGWED